MSKLIRAWYEETYRNESRLQRWGAILVTLLIGIAFVIPFVAIAVEAQRVAEARQVEVIETTILSEQGQASCVELELLKGNVVDGYTVVMHKDKIYILEDARFYGRPLASGPLFIPEG